MENIWNVDNDSTIQANSVKDVKMLLVSIEFTVLRIYIISGGNSASNKNLFTHGTYSIDSSIHMDEPGHMMSETGLNFPSKIAPWLT